MDDGCRSIRIFARYRELASGIEKVACSWELDEVICSLRPQYEDRVIEILDIATECDVVILTEAKVIMRDKVFTSDASQTVVKSRATSSRRAPAFRGKLSISAFAVLRSAVSKPSANRL
jgi:hypothetical protein